MTEVDERLVHSLRHVLLKAREPVRGCEGDYEKAYNFWLEMWRSTFAEINPEIQINSDAFLNHREVSAVFLDDSVLGLIMYDFRDLRLQAHRDLSYFRHYPTAAIEQLEHQVGGQIMTISQLTVHPNWRRKSVGPFMSDLLMGLAMRRFLASDKPVLVAFTRNDRGTQELCYRFGATPLYRGHEAYGIPSDVVCFYRENVRESSLPNMSEVVDRIWHGTSVTRLFSDLPPALRRNTAENDMVVLMNDTMSKS